VPAALHAADDGRSVTSAHGGPPGTPPFPSSFVGPLDMKKHGAQAGEAPAKPTPLTARKIGQGTPPHPPPFGADPARLEEALTGASAREAPGRPGGAARAREAPRNYARAEGWRGPGRCRWQSMAMEARVGDQAAGPGPRRREERVPAFPSLPWVVFFWGSCLLFFFVSGFSFVLGFFIWGDGEAARDLEGGSAPGDRRFLWNNPYSSPPNTLAAGVAQSYNAAQFLRTTCPVRADSPPAPSLSARAPLVIDEASIVPRRALQPKMITYAKAKGAKISWLAM